MVSELFLSCVHLFTIHLSAIPTRARNAAGEIIGVSEKRAYIVTSLGSEMDDFLDSFGYSNTVIDLLFNAFLNHTSDIQGFVDEMAGYGMAGTEAEWMHYSIDREVMDSPFMRTRWTA